jgi:hypothetical protein
VHAMERDRKSMIFKLFEKAFVRRVTRRMFMRIERFWHSKHLCRRAAHPRCPQRAASQRRCKRRGCNGADLSGAAP